jgi:hypothetical protein
VVCLTFVPSCHYISFTEKLFFKRCYPNWWRQSKNYMSSNFWQKVVLPLQVLILDVKGLYDIFAFVIFFWGKISNLAHYHRIIWSIWHIKASSSKKWQHCWINIYRLRKKIIAYVKNEGTNLSTMKPTTWNLLWVVKSYIRRMLMWNYWHIRVKDTCILMYCNEWLKWYKDLEVCIVSKFY